MSCSVVSARYCRLDRRRSDPFIQVANMTLAAENDECLHQIDSTDLAARGDVDQ